MIMDILHLKLGKFGIDILWLKTRKSLSPFYLLPTVRFGKTHLVYMQIYASSTY